MIALLLLLATSGVDPRVTEAQQLSAHGDDEAALQALLTVLGDVEASGKSGSAALHHNVGTLALKTGDAGLAMQHLLSAARRDPWNEDTRHNLALATELRADRLESSSTTPAGAELPPRAARFFFSFSALLFGAALLVRGARGSRTPRVLVASSATLFLIASALLLLRLSFERTILVVVRQETKARQAADPKATGFDVHPGLVGTQKQEKSGFLQLRLENGVDVWIASADVATVR